MSSPADAAFGSRYRIFDGRFVDIGLPPRPVNVFELSGFPRREAVASNVLAYFLDPADERHGLGNLVVDALLRELDGARLLGPSGRAFSAVDAVGSREWVVETEHTTDDRKRIDIYLTNDTLGLAIIIENKLDAPIANPFESYARRASERYDSVLAVVLAPSPKDIDHLAPATAGSISATITYDQLFDRFLPELAQAEGADPRSMDLLRQFIENVSEKRTTINAETENQVLERFWQELRGRESGYRGFFAALSTVDTILTRRAEALSALIRPRLEATDLLEDWYVTSGYSKRWGLRDGRLAVVYAGFRLRSGATIELVVGFIPEQELYGLHVKAFGFGRGPEQPFPGFDWTQLEATLADNDEIIAETFVERVGALMAAYPANPI